MPRRPRFDDEQGDATWLTDPTLALATVDHEQEKHRSRHNENRDFLRCYWDRPFTPSSNYSRSSRAGEFFSFMDERYGGNLTRSVVDAAMATLCRQLSAEVHPLGADFELEQGCKEASRLIEGVFDNSDFLSIATRCARNGMTADVGPCLGYVEDSEIKFEPVHPLACGWVDDGTDEPQTTFIDHAASRAALIGRFPEKADELRRAPGWLPKPIAGVDPPGIRDSRHTVRRVELWARQIGENVGKHLMVVAGENGPIILEDEEWKHETSPLFFFRWQDELEGQGGVSLTRIIAQWDKDRRRLMRQLYGGLAGSVPIVLEQENSLVEGLSDVPFQRVKYAGSLPPQIVVPSTVSVDVVNQIKLVEIQAYAEGGVNQNMATGSAPARYTSAVAQREFVDIANQRLALAQKQWERFWRHAARVVVMLAQQARKAHVRVKGANYYEAVSFPSLSRDKYRIHFGLSSGLSLTPAGRLQELQDLKDAGVIDVPDVLRNLDLPDTRALADRVNAPRDLVMKQISKALDHGEFEMPSGMQDLAGLVKVGSEEYQRAQLQGTYPAKHMETLRKLLLAAKARMPPAPAPVPAAPPAPAPVAAAA